MLNYVVYTANKYSTCYNLLACASFEGVRPSGAWGGVHWRPLSDASVSERSTVCDRSRRIVSKEYQTIDIISVFRYYIIY